MILYIEEIKPNDKFKAWLTFITYLKILKLVCVQLTTLCTISTTKIILLLRFMLLSIHLSQLNCN